MSANKTIANVLRKRRQEIETQWSSQLLTASPSATGRVSAEDIWKQAMHFFPEPVAVEPGDRLDIAAGYDNTRIFFNLLGHHPR